MSKSRPLVLHVTEAMGGGLEAAIVDYVRSAAGYDHALLYTRRGAFGTEDLADDLFLSSSYVGTGAISLLSNYRRSVRSINPDIIHLHSAWAGLIGRLPVLRRHSDRIVYSPHSFYFERADLPRGVQLLAWTVERLLVHGTAAVAALTPYEARLVSQLGGRAEYIPNVVRLPRGAAWRGQALADGGEDVVAIGRIAGQKDPQFFLDVKRFVEKSCDRLRWTWIGDGGRRMRGLLESAGVNVLGWVPRSSAIEQLSAASVYLHTAAWEGSPITLLEVQALGVPYVARSIPSLVSLGYDDGLVSPEAVAARLLSMLEGRFVSALPAVTRPTQAEQAEALDRLYALVDSDCGS